MDSSSASKRVFSLKNPSAAFSPKRTFSSKATQKMQWILLLEREQNITNIILCYVEYSSLCSFIKKYNENDKCHSLMLPVIWVFRASTWVVRVETSFSLFVSFSRVSNRKNEVINTGIEYIFHILKCLKMFIITMVIHSVFRYSNYGIITD